MGDDLSSMVPGSLLPLRHQFKFKNETCQHKHTPCYDTPAPSHMYTNSWTYLHTLWQHKKIVIRLTPTAVLKMRLSICTINSVLWYSICIDVSTFQPQ